MKTITEIFREISDVERSMLMYAFEEGQIDFYIEYTPGRFIGVDVGSSELTIEQISGHFSEGYISNTRLKFPVSFAYQPFEQEA